MTSVSILTALKSKNLQNVAALPRRLLKNRTISKVKSVFESKNNKLDELTSKNFSTKPLSFLISTSQVKRDAVSESKCSGCGKSGEFPFKKETEPQTGILKLEFFALNKEKYKANIK